MIAMKLPPRSTAVLAVNLTPGLEVCAMSTILCHNLFREYLFRRFYLLMCHRLGCPYVLLIY